MKFLVTTTFVPSTLYLRRLYLVTSEAEQPMNYDLPSRNRLILVRSRFKFPVPGFPCVLTASIQSKVNQANTFTPLSRGITTDSQAWKKFLVQQNSSSVFKSFQVVAFRWQFVATVSRTRVYELVCAQPFLMIYQGKPVSNSNIYYSQYTYKPSLKRINPIAKPAWWKNDKTDLWV